MGQAGHSVWRLAPSRISSWCCFPLWQDRVARLWKKPMAQMTWGRPFSVSGPSRFPYLWGRVRGLNDLLVPAGWSIVYFCPVDNIDFFILNTKSLPSPVYKYFPHHVAISFPIARWYFIMRRTPRCIYSLSLLSIWIICSFSLFGRYRNRPP